MSNNLEQMAQELTDPVTLDLVEDPIVVPCCTKAFSRQSLVQTFNNQRVKKCPACNQEIPDFDPLTAPRNVVIANMVDTLKQQQAQARVQAQQVQQEQVEEQAQQWKAIMTPVNDEIAELRVSVENSQFRVRPSLFIAVCDTSGSMSGNPWKQVETALIHIMGMTQSNPMVKTVIVRYSSMADVIDTSGTQKQVVYRIKTMFNSGGTSFVAAFQKVKEVLGNYKYCGDDDDPNIPNAVSNVTIAFLTDGQDNSHSGREALVESFKDSLCDWPGPICVHSVGFSGGCDRQFLENLRLAGGQEGTFRYAEPQDDADSLCQKLTGLFEVISQNSTVPVLLGLEAETNILFRKTAQDYCSDLSVQFPIARNGKGTSSYWILRDKQKDEDWQDLETKLPQLIINSSLEQDLEVPLVLAEQDHRLVERQKKLFEKWIATLIDGLAAELLDLNTQKADANSGGAPISLSVIDLHAALIEQRIDAIRTQTQNEDSINRLEFLSQQTKALRKGTAIHEGKLSDLRFGSQFAAVKPLPTTTHTHTHTTIPLPEPQVEAIEPRPEYHREYPVNYSHNGAGKDRNEFQERVMQSSNVPNILNLDSLTPEDLLHTDIDGNNLFHLACYCGHSHLVKEILEKFGDLIKKEQLLDRENPAGETPMTLAVKKRGFWKTLKVMVEAGGTIPSYRKKGLEEFAVNNGYPVTAKLLGSLDGANDDTLAKEAATVNHKMTPDYIEFLYETAMERNIQIDAQVYLEVCLAKTMTKLVKQLLQLHNAVPTLQMVMDYCFPPKPDHPETVKYLTLAKMTVKSCRELLSASNADNETLLFRSAEKGSLPHLQFFLREYPENLEQANLEGNTPLHIACYKQYPCIMEVLINHGANVNYRNLKGNVPLLSSCQRGPLKIAELLLSAGADIRNINDNGDTLILLCCRNGQHEKLKLFLNYVEPEFVDIKAHIDGFNAIFASVEANRPQCVEALHHYGVDIEQKTDLDNQILPGSTPMHLGAYYGCLEAVQMLLTCGADPNSRDLYQMTPLHVAVIQKQPLIIKLLLNSGANPGLRDKEGNIPATYCRTDQQLREILINPALDAVTSLARGEFRPQQVEKQACEVLHKHCGAIGCLSVAKALNLVAPDGSTPLLQSVLYSNYQVTRTLVELGCDINFKDRFGLSAHVWAKWINNPRINTLLKDLDTDPEETQKCLDRLRTSADAQPQNARILFLSNRPQNIAVQLSAKLSVKLSSGLDARMEQFLNTVYVYRDQDLPEEFQQATAHVNRYLSLEGSGENGVESHQTGQLAIQAFDQDDFKTQAYNILVWRAKVITAGLIASGKTMLEPSQAVALCLYTNNPVISNSLNRAILSSATEPENLEKFRSYLQCMSGVWQTLMPFQGEVFIGANPDRVDRNLFLVGNKVVFRTFISGSTSWRVATEHVEKFTEKKHEGTVLLVKSKTGRFVGQHSEFGYDMEILFKPDTRFEVTAWYRGTVICLGQANIREHTFGLPEEADRLPYRTNKKNLVIELTEI